MRTVLATLLLVASATSQAVMIDPSGRGEVLLMPYYTVNAGQQTLLTVVNHSSTGKAVKLRFREGRNGREVYAFNLYLAEFDVWTAALFADSDTGEARLLTQDNSCTVPAIKTSTSLPQLANGTRYAAFGNADYSGARADDGPSDLARTREGSVELIEMGTLVNNSDSDLALTHVGGVPRDCNVLVEAWNNTSGYWTADPATDLLPPSGQMSGTASIVDVRGGALYGVAATALSRFSVVVQHSGPTAALPDLSSAVTETAREKVESITIAEGRIFRSYWPQARAFDAVTAALMASQLHNDYNVDPAIGAQSDWVLTFPTRRFYPATDPSSQVLPFAAFNPGGGAQSCVPRAVTTYDRETRRPIGAVDLGTNPPPESPAFYCRATQVLAFGSTTSLLGADAPARIPTSFGSGGFFANGWANLQPDAARQTRPAQTGETYQGVPAIGFWALRYRNTAAKPGELGIYAAAKPHQRSAQCQTADRQSCSPL